MEVSAWRCTRCCCRGGSGEYDEEDEDETEGEALAVAVVVVTVFEDARTGLACFFTGAFVMAEVGFAIAFSVQVQAAWVIGIPEVSTVAPDPF